MSLVLKGIIPPMVTPLDEKGRLDYMGLERLIDHMLDGGVHGIFLLGTNGEAPSLSYDLRKELVQYACTYIDKRVPVLVGITDTSMDGALDMANCAKGAGADAVVIAPPYYFPISQMEMVDYLKEIVPKLPLPFMMYNMPSCTKLHLSLETVRVAKELGALGIKDSSGDKEYLFSLIEAFKDSPEFSIIVGTEAFLSDTVARGGHGAVAGGANFFPRLFVAIYQASLEKNTELVDRLNKKVFALYDTIYKVGQYESRYTKGTKCALAVMGICEDHMAMPLRRLGPAEREQVRIHLEKLEGSNTAI